MEKRVRCTIRRSNHKGEMYNNDLRPIGFGYQGKSFQLMEGKLVCLPKEALYCFTDAVIEHTKVVKNSETGKTSVENIRIPRFNIDYEGYYVCNKECNGDFENCKGTKITRDDFESDEQVDEKAEVFEDIVAKPKRAAKSDIESILE